MFPIFIKNLWTLFLPNLLRLRPLMPQLDIGDDFCIEVPIDKVHVMFECCSISDVYVRFLEPTALSVILKISLYKMIVFKECRLNEIK
jgi:hypothetical protein